MRNVESAQQETPETVDARDLSDRSRAVFEWALGRSACRYAHYLTKKREPIDRNSIDRPASAPDRTGRVVLDEESRPKEYQFIGIDADLVKKRLHYSRI